MSKFFASGDSSRAAHGGVPRSAGFSLIELAIGLIILGLIMLPIAEMYRIYMKSLSLSDTRGAQNEITTAINQFYQNGNLRYPCPASLIAPEDSFGYGREGVCTGGPPVRPCTSAAWRTTSGICRTTGPGSQVVIGAVPFKALGIDADRAKDFWDNRLLYAVTLNQTDSATFTTEPGSISLFTMDRASDDDGIPDLYCSDPPANTDCYSDVDFVLVSTGRNGAGGFAGSGAEMPACPGSAAGREYFNCDMDRVFLHHTDPDDPTVGARSDRMGDTFYDDILAFQRSIPENTWYPTPVGLSHVITGAAHVGIGIPSATTHMLEVGGSAQVDGGVKTDRVCDENQTSCFDPELITGDMPQMQCDSASTFYGDQAVVKFKENRVRCALPADNLGSGPVSGDGEIITLPSSFVDGDCAGASKLMTGFDASGAPVCVIP